MLSPAPILVSWLKGGIPMSNQQQVDNLVELLDGYSQKGGHHLNVNVFTRETLLDAQNILSCTLN